MPYVEQSLRGGLRPTSEYLATNAGELTYQFYALAVGYGASRYAEFAEVVAALEAAKLEFYRRHVAPYEDRKMLENGDVS